MLTEKNCRVGMVIRRTTDSKDGTIKAGTRGIVIKYDLKGIHGPGIYDEKGWPVVLEVQWINPTKDIFWNFYGLYGLVVSEH